ncbi:MAG: hypothetical protein WD066_06820 [Planctomycetaceae bacterium]
MDWFWRYIAIYLGFLGVALAPAFDDFERFAGSRRTVLGVFTAGCCFFLAVALANVDGARPHIGHLAGWWGVLRYDLPKVVYYMGLSAIVAGPFIYCLESVARGGWDRIRRFRRAE